MRRLAFTRRARRRQVKATDERLAYARLYGTLGPRPLGLLPVPTPIEKGRRR